MDSKHYEIFKTKSGYKAKLSEYSDYFIVGDFLINLHCRATFNLVDMSGELKPNDNILSLSLLVHDKIRGLKK